jgi:hypothetical protein
VFLTLQLQPVADMAVPVPVAVIQAAALVLLVVQEQAELETLHQRVQHKATMAQRAIPPSLTMAVVAVAQVRRGLGLMVVRERQTALLGHP